MITFDQVSELCAANDLSFYCFWDCPSATWHVEIWEPHERGVWKAAPVRLGGGVSFDAREPTLDAAFREVLRQMETCPAEFDFTVLEKTA